MNNTPKDQVDTEEISGGNIDTEKQTITTPTGMGLGEIGARLKVDPKALPDESGVKQKESPPSRKNSKKGAARKSQLLLDLIFGRSGKMRSLAGRILTSKKDSVDASKMFSRFRDESSREESSPALSKQISDEITELSDRIDDLNESVADLTTKYDDHARVSVETLNKVSDSVETVKERVAENDTTIPEPEAKAERLTPNAHQDSREYLHHAVKGMFRDLTKKQISELLKSAAGSTDEDVMKNVIKSGGSFEALEKREEPKAERVPETSVDSAIAASTIQHTEEPHEEHTKETGGSVIKSGGSFEALEKREEPKAERVPETSVDSAIAASTTQHTEEPHEEHTKETGGSVNRKLDRILAILNSMKGKRQDSGKTTNDTKKNKKPVDDGFKATDLIFGKSLGKKVRDLMGKKVGGTQEPENTEKSFASKMKDRGRGIVEKMTKGEKNPISRMLGNKTKPPGLGGVPKLPGAPEGAGGAAAKSVGGIAAAVGGGLAIAAVAGHFINKGLKKLDFQGALDGGALDKAGRQATETNKFESSQARTAGKLEGTGYELVAPGKYKDTKGNIVSRENLPEEVQKKLPGGVMAGKATSENIAPQKNDISAQVTPPKTETTQDGEKRSLIVSKEKPVIINGGGNRSKPQIVLITRNMEPSVATYTASIFDHPVVHPGIYKM